MKVKLYLNLYRDPGDGRYFGYIDDRPSDAAKTFAILDRYPIEVDVPSPEWKVGDWFEHSHDSEPLRIVDIAGGRYSAVYRFEGASESKSGDLADLDAHATRCDPPEWAEEAS